MRGIIDTPPPQLDYAPGRSLVTRIGRRRLIWLTILVAVALAAVIWTDPAIRRIRRWNAERRFLSLQREAMSYTAPADRVVYEEDSVKSAALEARDANYVPIDTVDFRDVWAIRPKWQPPARRKDALWSAYAVGPARASGDPRTTAFLGERTTPSGERRLVCVGIAVGAQLSAGGRWGINRWLQAWSFKPGSLEHADSLAPMGLMHIDSGAQRPPGELDPLTDDLANPFNPPFPMRLFAGQPDPGDTSKFTIAYELDGHRGVITGAVNDDGSVIMTPDIGWHGKLDTTVSWNPKAPKPTAPTSAPAARRQ